MMTLNVFESKIVEGGLNGREIILLAAFMGGNLGAAASCMSFEDNMLRMITTGALVGTAFGSGIAAIMDSQNTLDGW